MRRNVGTEKNTAHGGKWRERRPDVLSILPPLPDAVTEPDAPELAPPEDAVTVTVDGVEVQVPAGVTIFQAAEAVGYTPPHFCYHRDLSVPANCRMCLCEVEGQRKLQTSCSIQVSDGMVVKFDTPAVKEAVQGVLEFEFKNHPLDCPVCDQVGECFLQKYYLEVGKYDPLPMDRVRKDKVVDLGPITLDAERCVLCSRCVRFGEEITGSGDFVIANRSDHSEIKTFADRKITTDYALNYTDICPVGALTSNDFRFRKRVYYLHTVESICQGCSTGCNIYAEQSEDVLYRYRPRYNDAVNDSWMCDPGRISSNELADTTDRIALPAARSNGAAPIGDWDGAIAAAAEAIGALDGSVAVIAHPDMPNEALGELKRFADTVGAGRVDFRADDTWRGLDELVDGILIRRDPHPNGRGALEILGLDAGSDSDVPGILADVTAGQIKALVVCGWDLAAMGDEAKAALDRAEWVCFVGPRECATASLADVVLPTPVHVEHEGTFTNHAGRVQRFEQCVSLYEESRPGWWVFARLREALGAGSAPKTAAAAFDAIGDLSSAFEGLEYDAIPPDGTWLKGWEPDGVPPVGRYPRPGFKSPSPQTT